MAAIIAYYVQPVNIQTTSKIREGAEITQKIINIVEFFFFQAEDGIRDYKVTGVQTCALPISLRSRPARATPAHRAIAAGWRACARPPARSAWRRHRWICAWHPPLRRTWRTRS